MTGWLARVLERVLPSRLGSAFRWNIASVWTSNLGDGIAAAAGPLLVASQTRSPVLIAAAAMARTLPSLVAGLYAGALADRVNRITLTVWSNVVRVLVIGALIATMVSGTVSIGIVLAALLAVGVAEVFADSGSRSVLPMIVPSEHLGVANARAMSGYLVADQLVGPPLGALLFAAGMVWPFGVHVLCMVLATWLFTRITIPRGGVRGRVETHIRHDIAEGWRWLWAHDAVRTLALVIFAFNLTWGAAWSILVLYSLEVLGMGPVGFGLLTTAAALGGLLSTAGYDWLEGRFALATIMKACLTLEVLTHLGLALTRVPAVALGIMVVFGGYAFVWATVSTTVRQRAVPDELMGRVGSVYMVGLTGGLLVGQLLGGLLATRWGLLAPFWFAFVGSGLTLLLVWPRLDAIAHTERGPESASLTG